MKDIPPTLTVVHDGVYSRRGVPVLPDVGRLRRGPPLHPGPVPVVHRDFQLGLLAVEVATVLTALDPLGHLRESHTHIQKTALSGWVPSTVRTYSICPY